MNLIKQKIEKENQADALEIFLNLRFKETNTIQVS